MLLSKTRFPRCLLVVIGLILPSMAFVGSVAAEEEEQETYAIDPPPPDTDPPPIPITFAKRTEHEALAKEVFGTARATSHSAPPTNAAKTETWEVWVLRGCRVAFRKTSVRGPSDLTRIQAIASSMLQAKPGQGEVRTALPILVVRSLRPTVRVQWHQQGEELAGALRGALLRNESGAAAVATVAK